jgi:hypothetical protein
VAVAWLAKLVVEKKSIVGLEGTRNGFVFNFDFVVEVEFGSGAFFGPVKGVPNHTSILVSGTHTKEIFIYLFIQVYCPYETLGYDTKEIHCNDCR